MAERRGTTRRSRVARSAVASVVAAVGGTAIVLPSPASGYPRDDGFPECWNNDYWLNWDDNANTAMYESDMLGAADDWEVVDSIDGTDVHFIHDGTPIGGETVVDFGIIDVPVSDDSLGLCDPTFALPGARARIAIDDSNVGDLGDIRRLSRHEMGHTLQLGHSAPTPDSPNPVMGSCGKMGTSLTIDDRAAIMKENDPNPSSGGDFIFANPGFEDFQTGWTKEAGATASTITDPVAHSGDRFTRFETNWLNASSAYTQNQMVQALHDPGGTTLRHYRMRAEYKAAGLPASGEMSAQLWSRTLTYDTPDDCGGTVFGIIDNSTFPGNDITVTLGPFVFNFTGLGDGYDYNDRTNEGAWLMRGEETVSAAQASIGSWDSLVGSEYATNFYAREFRMEFRNTYKDASLVPVPVDIDTVGTAVALSTPGVA